MMKTATNKSTYIIFMMQKKLGLLYSIAVT